MRAPMANKLLHSLVLVFSVLLALGSYDPFFPAASQLTSSHIVLVLFVGSYSFLYPRSTIEGGMRAPVLALFSIFFVLGLSQAFYGDSIYSISPLNIKYLMCVIFFTVLSSYYSKFPISIHYSLLFYSLSAAIFSMAVLYFFGGASEIYKGQLIVFGENPNSTAARMAVAFVYVMSVCIQNPLTWGRTRYLLLLPAIPLILLIVKSGSRGALLAVMASAISLIVFSKIKRRHKFYTFTFSLMLLFPLFGYIASIEGVSARWERVLEGDTAGRTEIWIDAVSIFLNSPVIGVGEGGYYEEMLVRYGSFIDTHNIILYLAVSGGVVAVSLFMYFCYSLLSSAWRSFQGGDIFPFVLFLNIMIVALKTGGVLTYLVMWYLFAMIASYRRLLGALE